MKFRLLALDLDGTLLNNKKAIDNKTIEYLSLLAKNGVKIVIATGRSFYDAERLTSLLPFNFVIIANNGAVTRTPKTKNNISGKFIKNEDYRIIINESIKYNLHPIVFVDKFYDGYDIIIEHDYDFEAYNGYMTKLDKRYKKIDFLSYFDEDILAMCYTGKLSEMNTFKNHILNKYPNKFNSLTALKLNVEALLEFLNIESCKWKSLVEYSSSIGIKKEEILTFGDDNNDLEMLKESGLGIAMINGTEEAKKNADRISALTNDQNGVLCELKKIYGE
jgi:hypothetical protein